MKQLILDLFGTYEPVSYLDADSVSVIPSGVSGLDWPWIAGVGLFALTLYCVFRILGGFYKR